MKQTDQFGQFNREIRRYGIPAGAMITVAADVAREHLRAVSDPEKVFYDLDAYMDSIVEAYQVLYRMVQTKA